MCLQKEKGFSLIELIVAITVIAILAAAAIPTFRQWLPNMRLKAAARDLFGAAMLAKGEAVKRNKWCALSFNQSISGKNMVYAVFEDTDKDCEYDAGEPVLLKVQNWPKQVSLDTSQGGGTGITFLLNDNNRPTIVFSPTSIPVDDKGRVPNGSAFLKSSTGTKVKLVINQTGNISIQ